MVAKMELVRLWCYRLYHHGSKQADKGRAMEDKYLFHLLRPPFAIITEAMLGLSRDLDFDVLLLSLPSYAPSINPISSELN